MEVEQTQGGGLNLSDYLGVFTRRIWLILIPFVLVLVIAGGLGLLLPPKYRASTRVKVEELGFLERFNERGGFNVPFKPFLATINEEVRRRSFLEDLIRRYGITEGYDVSDPRERQKLFSYVIKNLEVSYFENKKGPDLFGFSYTGRDAARVARFVNAVRQKYLEFISSRIVEIVSQTRAQLMQRTLAAEADYNKAVEELRRFEDRGEYSLAGPEILDLKHERLAKVRAQLADDAARLKGLEAQLDQALLDRKTTVAVTVTETQERNPEHTKARLAVQVLEERLKKLKEKYTDVWPLVQETKEELERARDHLATVPEFLPKTRTPQENPLFQELDALVLKLQRQISSLQAEVKRRKEEVKVLESEVEKIPTIRAQVQRLELARESAASRLRRAEGLLSDAEATYARVTSKDSSIFTVLTAPTPEEARTWDPVFPNVGLFIGAGALIGLLFGAGLAFLVEFSNQSYVTARQVRRLLPVPLLGQVEPIQTSTERRALIRRRLTVAAVALVVLSALTWVHVAYFTQDLQEKLPPAVFDFMKRIYGTR